MNTNNIFYDESDDIENELFLSAIPLNLLEEAIKSQFNDPLEYRKTDYVKSFINKYEFSVNNMYEDDQAELDSLQSDFIEFMEKMFYNYLQIGIDNIYDYNADTQHELIHFTYKFFINDIKKNFVNLVCNIIDTRKDEITSISNRKKDVIYLNFRSEINDEYDVLVLSNLSTIINYVLSSDYTVDEFFDLCESINNNSQLELQYVRRKFDAFILTGNFVPSYKKMINKDFKNEIESKVRNKILKKYPKRKSEIKNNLNEETVDESIN